MAAVGTQIPLPTSTFLDEIRTYGFGITIAIMQRSRVARRVLGAFPVSLFIAY